MYQSEDMFDLEQHQHFLDMDLASLLTSSESDIGMRNGNEDSGNENMEAPPSGEDEGPNGQERPKRKSYARHTQQQIQEMEAFFKECPHPDDRQRKELSRVLGLRPMQIKFWFQNKRTQAKTQREHHLNDLLRAENEKLRAENTMYKEALGNASCISCGGPASVGEMSFEEQHLRLENSRLREEIQKMSGASSSNYVGNPVVSYSQNQMPSSSLDVGAGGTSSNYGSQSGMVGQMYYGSSSGGGTRSDLPRSQLAPPSANSDKQMIVELAVAAMDELTRLALMGAPLWIPCGNSEILNVDEYTRSFPGGIGPKLFGFRTEASRDSVIVLMNPINLIEILMDVNQWSAMFSGIVPSGMTVEVLSTGLAGNYNGALQVMSAEFQIPSPLIPTRDNYFVRYCKQHQEGTWAVVDVSLDHLRPSTTSLRSRRRPSGCLIQELPSGYSKVTWVEHVEVDDTVVVMHNHYKPLITSCLAFGAKRWLASLERQCERLASSMAINIPPGDLCVIMSPEGRKSMLKLAERMIMSFCTGVGTSKAHAWIPVDPVDGDDLKVMTRKSTNEPGTPPGILLSAATSFWLPITPKRVFDFIRNENSRTEWDILSNGGEVQEMAHIANGRDPANCVSLFRVNSVNCNQNNMLILQESCNDSSGSYVVYAPIDIGAMNLVLGGGDPSPVPLIPSGFAILPDGPAGLNGGEPIPDIIGSGGTMLTVAFQILIDSSPSSKLSQASVTTVSALIKRTVQRIKAAVVAPNTTA